VLGQQLLYQEGSFERVFFRLQAVVCKPIPTDNVSLHDIALEVPQSLANLQNIRMCYLGSTYSSGLLAWGYRI
jgi:hypothetical protein